MTGLIILFGALTGFAGFLIILNPELIFGPIRNNLEKVQLHVTAVVIRVILGGLLIKQADLSRFPLAIEIIGWLSIAAALSFTLIGRARFIRLMEWALTVTSPLGRVGGVAALAFGIFLVYSFGL